MVVALAHAGAAFAQTAEPAPAADQAQAAEVKGPTRVAAADDAPQAGEILVTGSRIERAGFNAPTPTTVVGSTDLRMGDRPSVAQVLDDLPQFRATSTPATTTGNTNNSASTADLRGLGSVRTLTLLDGRRFTGSADLSVIPQSIIKRVEVVTGGASAAWGSGAVAGVVNIILDDDLKGLTLGANTGISTRADDPRYSFNATYGTHFADGRGHFMIAGEYLKDKGAFDRDDGSRPNLDSAIFTTSAKQLILANNVNYTIINPGGIINGGPGARLVFNPNGTLSPLILGSQTNGSFTVGGNGKSLYDYVAVTSPYNRANIYVRGSFDFSDAAKIWVDGSYSRIHSNFPFFPQTPIFAVQQDNPFLTPAARAQLSAIGATYPLTVGRILADIGSTGTLGYESTRRNLEAATGIEGSLGGTWKYSAYYGHGELRNDQTLYNQSIVSNFANAINAVTSPTTGQPICRIALTDPTTACRPLNLLGAGNASPEAIAYAFGAARQITTTKLDTTGFSLRGDPFSTWAGPVSIAVGGDFRWEGFKTNYIDPISRAGGFTTLNFAPLNGNFNVQEGFGEVVVPLLDAERVAHIEFNGAARYSHYSNSGGIWSWKAGGTARMFEDLLLRAVYSRDIRSPNTTELFTTRTTNISNVTDPFNGNISVPNVVRFGGGNPNLTPETSHTLTLGGSYSPSFAKAFSFSADFYKIDIRNVIATLAAQDIINQCFKGNNAACGAIVRDSSGSITTIFGTYLNLASYKTKGLDLEASYLLPMDKISGKMDGSLRFRLLATHVFNLTINDGVNTYDRAGIVGDTSTFSTPKWRGTGSITYQTNTLGVDLRVRYVGGGKFADPTQQPILNNKVTSRTYVDLGFQQQIGAFTIFATVNNLFDRDPPYVTYATTTYDMIGRYFSGGVKIKI
jgi:iron complex outermembrane recepter protein